jgi:hypothetical protein
LALVLRNVPSQVTPEQAFPFVKSFMGETPRE